MREPDGVLGTVLFINEALHKAYPYADRTWMFKSVSDAMRKTEGGTKYYWFWTTMISDLKNKYSQYDHYTLFHHYRTIVGSVKAKQV